MLQSIREATQGWIAGVIISIIILTFALWGIHSYFVGGASHPPVAKVNGVEISQQQLMAAYDRLRRQAQLQHASNNAFTMPDETVLKDRALHALIELEALRQASLQQGYRISDQQLDNFLQSVPEFQVNGQFSEERFHEALAANMISISEFIDLLKSTMLIDQPKHGIFFSAFALPDETNYAIALINQERDIQYITIPFEHFLATTINIPADQIKQYYTAHKNEFMTPEQVSIEYIELSLKHLSDTITPTESMLKSFYNENVNAYTQPAQWKVIAIELPGPTDETALKQAEAARDALLNGTEPSKIPQAKMLNLNAQEWVTLNQLPAPLQNVILSELNKPNQVTNPIKTNTGFVLVKAVDIKQPSIQTFEEAKDKVREAYIKQHAEEKFMELREQLADLTYEHPDSLQPAAKVLNLPIQQSEVFTKDKGGKDISQHKKVRNIAFSNDVVNLQNNSDIIQIASDTAVVIHVKTHKPAALLPLNEVSKQIEDKLKTKEMEIRTEKFVTQLVDQLQKGADPAQLASNNKLTWNNVGYIGRYSDKVVSAILVQAFRMPAPETAKNKVTYGSIRLPNGYAIIALKGVKSGSQADAKQFAAFAEQAQNNEGILEYELYKQSQIKHASIKMQ